jgi:hypothetical protein
VRSFFPAARLQQIAKRKNGARARVGAFAARNLADRGLGDICRSSHLTLGKTPQPKFLNNDFCVHMLILNGIYYNRKN